jgi:hypothetical protein
MSPTGRHPLPPAQPVQKPWHCCWGFSFLTRAKARRRGGLMRRESRGDLENGEPWPSVYGRHGRPRQGTVREKAPPKRGQVPNEECNAASAYAAGVAVRKAATAFRRAAPAASYAVLKHDKGLTCGASPNAAG